MKKLPITWSALETVPTCEFEEKANDYVIRLEMPDLKKKDIHVTMCGGVLTVSGEQKREKHAGSGSEHVTEKFHSVFKRSFSLPEAGNADRVHAEYNNGVLHIEVSKNGRPSKSFREIPLAEETAALPAKRVRSESNHKSSHKAA